MIHNQLKAAIMLLTSPSRLRDKRTGDVYAVSGIKEDGTLLIGKPGLQRYVEIRSLEGFEVVDSLDVDSDADLQYRINRNFA